jgi:hypothetical protein
LGHFDDNYEKIEERRELLREVIDFDTDINEYLEDIKTEVDTKEVTWRFAGITAEEDYIYGKIGKEKSEKDYQIDNEKKDYIPDKRESKHLCHFLINLRYGIMAYENKNYIGSKAPFRIIRDTVNSYYGRDEIEASVVTDPEKLMEKLNQFSRIVPPPLRPWTAF